MASIAYNPSEVSQEAILKFSRSCHTQHGKQWNIRSRLEEIDKAYQRETDNLTESRRAEQAVRRGDTKKFRNITMPVVMPQVEAAVAYQQSVFLTGYPIFGVVSYPEFQEEALMLDTIIGEQQIEAGWIAELLGVIRNGFKYNIGAAEVSWRKKVSYAVQTDITRGVEGQAKEVIWAGNHIRSLDMYNTFFDTRCAPEDIPEHGEFAGYHELMSRIRIKQFIAELDSKINVKEALESSMASGAATWSPDDNSTPGSFYIPTVNRNSLIEQHTAGGTNWSDWVGLAGSESKIKYSDVYQVTTLYARILPSDFGFKGIPSKNTPQVWKFIIVNNQVVLHCERLTNLHNKIPIIFYSPLDDGIDYQTKSLAENILPFQEITTALANSSIASRRRAISDRMLFDPARVSAAALNNESPSAKIPVRPGAYMDDLSKAVYPFPFRDDQFQINGQEIQMFMGMADQTSGLNQARQGMFVKGNKTRHEFAETMQYANSRDQSIAIHTEATFYTPLKSLILMNILQYQGSGAVYNREQGVVVNVDPISLRKAAISFKVSDGLMPSEKLVDGESLAMGMQTLASSPQLAAGYNLAPLFSYLMGTRGAKLQPFEKSPEQQAYEQAVGQWQQVMMSIGEQLKSLPLEEAQAMLQQVSQSIPQPKPEDFGYVPGKPSLSNMNPFNEQSQGILQRIAAKTQSERPPEGEAVQIPEGGQQ